MRRKAKIIVYTGIFVLVFLAAALARVYLLGSAPERLVKSLGQDLTGTIFRDPDELRALLPELQAVVPGAQLRGVD